MDNTKGYQGWTNYQTWAVALWVDNDEGLYHERIRVVRRSLARGNAYDVERALKSWIEEMTPDMGATLWADLLTSALSDVDWSELAAHWIAEDEEGSK
jgi:hypothetical protein